jgi:hypothetical protein
MAEENCNKLCEDQNRRAKEDPTIPGKRKRVSD